VLDNGAFDVFAWGLLFLRCATAGGAAGGVAGDPGRRDAGRDRAGAGAPGLGARAAAGRLLLFSGPDVPAPVRPARLLLFALALETVWLSPLVAPLHMVLARLDAQVVPLLLGAVGQAPRGTATWWRTCRPVQHRDLAVLRLVLSARRHGARFTAIVMCRGTTLRRAHLPWLALSCLASMALTELRLVLLAGGKASYHWWHDGNGSVLYGLAALGLSVAFPIVATRVAPVPARGRLAGSAA